jgi:hypothetical protein
MAVEDLDPKSLLLKSLKGASIKDIPDLEAEDAWHFGFTVGGLAVQCPWRIVSSERVVLGSVDHKQWFGLPEPVDAVARASKLLEGKIVESVKIHDVTSDLTIQFTGDLRLEVFNNSSGYDGWQYGNRDGLELVAQGGGRRLMCYGERKDWQSYGHS